ncbi:hypothetical protein Tco_1413428, partial [Tanacetum coccineum]
VRGLKDAMSNVEKLKNYGDKEGHLSLQQNLMEHIWQQREDQDEEF